MFFSLCGMKIKNKRINIESGKNENKVIFEDHSQQMSDKFTLSNKNNLS